MMRVLVMACVAVCWSGVARAEFTAIGQGVSTCGTWTEYRSKNNAAKIEQWSLGFLSGVGWVHMNGEDPLHGKDAKTVFGWIDIYSRAFPLELVQEAVSVFASGRQK